MRQDLDITREHCPMTFVKVKLALSKIKQGDILDVLLTDGEPLSNVPRAAQEQGNRVVEIQKRGDFYRVTIEKA